MTEAEKQARRQVASLLDQALSFMRVSVSTDYFTGYSLEETMKQRIQQIGEDKPKAEDYTGKEQRLTAMGRLKVFEEMTLYAIGRAKEFE